MARELGMNPKKFGKISNQKQEPWKAPLPVFIEDIYFKRFGKRQPQNVKSIEQIAKIHGKKKAEGLKLKQLKKQVVTTGTNEGNATAHSS